MAALFATVIGDGVEVAIGPGVMQRAMLGKPFPVIPPLNHLEADEAAVGGAKDPSLAIKVQAPGVTAPLGEQLKLLGHWVEPPDPLLEPNATNIGRHR